jgi:hypothetical protein
LSHTVVDPSVPAVILDEIFTVAILVSLGQGEVPIRTYLKVEVVVPVEGVKVLLENIPPVPVSLVQTPPNCSPIIKLNKSIELVELSQTDVDPSDPALGAAVTLTVIVSVHPLALYIKLKAPVEVGKKLTEANPFVVEPRVAPAGLPG